jgi:hypothetical protein
MRPVWRYKIKTQQNIVTTYKSRLCADGSRVVDSPENTFAGTPLPHAINSTFAMAAFHGCKVHSGDIPAAYVQSPVPDGDTIYYIYQPEGYMDKDHPEWICKLNKCLYGIPCSGHQWNQTLAKFLMEEVGMNRSNTDPSIFYKVDESGFFIMPTNVDDTIDMSTSESLREQVHKALVDKFKWKDEGICHWYLGMRIRQNYEEISLDQTAFLANMLERFDLDGHIPGKDTPMKRLQVLEPPKQGDLKPKFPYQAIVGSLIWMTKTRPEIGFSVSQCAKHMSNYNEQHVKAAQYILGYLKKNPNFGLQFKMKNHNSDTPVNIATWVDSSWCDNKEDRSSSYGYVTTIEGEPIAYRFRINPAVCTSAAEAEYNAYCEGPKDARFTQQLFDELKILRNPIDLLGDSMTAEQLAQQWKTNQRTKHMDIRLHFIRHAIETKVHNKPIHVKSADNTADIFTKALGYNEFTRLRNRLVKPVPPA